MTDCFKHRFYGEGPCPTCGEEVLAAAPNLAKIDKMLKAGKQAGENIVYTCPICHEKAQEYLAHDCRSSDLKGKPDDRKVGRPYKKLYEVLDGAYKQASEGKGKERHANDDEPFENQKICEITRRVAGSPVAAMLYQAVKKSYESTRMSPEKAIHELLGAINYLAAAIILLEEAKNKEGKDVKETSR